MVRTSLLICVTLIAGGVPAQDQQDSAQIHVLVSPGGSTVRCDGRIHGIAPVTIPNLAPGRHLLVVAKQGFRQLRKSVVVEAGQKLTLELQLEPMHGLLLVHSTPAGAEVTINGASKGTTPALVTDMPFGAYRMQISRPGYLAKELDLRISRRRPERIAVALTANSAALLLDSAPPGADVTVNGIAQGRTPCSVENITSGEAHIEIGLKGYETFRQTVTVTPGQREELTAQLKAVPAKLEIVSRPEGARIYVDDQFRGEAPVVFDALDPGPYRVRAEMAGYEVTARDITLEPADDRVEEFRMQSDVGSLEITTEPAGVSIFIDGEQKGTTTSKPGETDRVSDPMRLRMVSSGKRMILLTKKGYYDIEIAVDIEREDVTVFHKKLKRRFIPDYEVRTKARTVRGVLVEIDEKGNLRLEVAPGIFKTINAADVRAHMPLRTGQ